MFFFFACVAECQSLLFLPLRACSPSFFGELFQCKKGCIHFWAKQCAWKFPKQTHTLALSPSSALWPLSLWHLIHVKSCVAIHRGLRNSFWFLWAFWVDLLRSILIVTSVFLLDSARVLKQTRISPNPTLRIVFSHNADSLSHRLCLKFSQFHGRMLSQMFEFQLFLVVSFLVFTFHEELSLAFSIFLSFFPFMHSSLLLNFLMCIGVAF